MLAIKKITFLLFFLFTFNFSHSQITPCIGGVANVSGGESFSCNDYDLLSNIPISVLANAQGNPEGSDIWGWTDPLNGNEYAIFATTNSTAFIDVTDPINPVFLGRIDTETTTSFWRDVKVYNNHAFIVADNVGAHGMQVFDLTNLRNVSNPPQTFTNYTLYSGVGSCHNVVINESESYAYLVGCDEFSGGLVFIDISNPSNPVSEGGYADRGYTHDAQVVTYNGPDNSPDPNTTSVPSYIGREILVASNGTFSNNDKLVFIDVTDKTNPVVISEVAYSNPGYAHQGWFTDDHRYFIMGDETDEQSYGMNTRTLVFDVQDLDNPTLSSTYFGPSMAIDHNGYVKGDKFYLANYRAGMRVLDITNISAASNSMTEVGYFDTYPENDNTAYDGAWSIYPYFNSGNIIIGDINRGLFIVRKSGTLSQPEFVKNNDFLITPNPTETNTKIISNGSSVIESVEIFNILGEKLFSANNINQKTFVLPIHTYAKGMYLVNINSNNTKKILLK
ncbi:choice-of-anchor B family protein [Hanstruepera marina]|uniref:choice-of-anchor B family protein n=1 Tax=Hanstruepera marina TaxID=2873265 RepID=UPI001CA72A81|nr:choice-of-anchor B family protein [Hanstruepera marina]